MISAKDQIFYNDTPVFTKVRVTTPVVEDLLLPSDACYLYINEGDNQPLAEFPSVSSSTGTTILSTCGLTVGNLISNNLKGHIDSTIVHLNKSLLKECFDGEKPALWEELQTPVNEYVVQEAAVALVKDFFDRINSLFVHKKGVNNQLIKLKLKEIVLLLLQTDNAQSVKQIIKSLFSERSFSFKEIIDAHLYTPANVDNLAQLTGHSLSTFKRRFKELYNASPAQYLLEKRLEKAAEKLRISDEQISHIGYQFGFESPEHLSRAFKKHFSQSPSQYRLSQSVKSMN